jgi:hypothetical protein
MAKQPTSVKVPAPIFAAAMAVAATTQAVTDMLEMANGNPADFTERQKTLFDSLSEDAKTAHKRVVLAEAVVAQMRERAATLAGELASTEAQIAAIREKHGFSKLDDSQAAALEYTLACVEGAILAGRDPNAETEAWDELRDTLIVVAKKRAACADELHPLMDKRGAAKTALRAANEEVTKAADTKRDLVHKMLAATDYARLNGLWRGAIADMQTFQLTAASQKQIVAAASERRLICV